MKLKKTWKIFYKDVCSDYISYNFFNKISIDIWTCKSLKGLINVYTFFGKTRCMRIKYKTGE